MPQLPYSVELHDSKLTAVRLTPDAVLIELRPSYVHRDGKGWRQDANIEVVGAKMSGTVAVPVRIADGELNTPSGPYHNLLTLPLSEHGPVHITLELDGGAIIELHGSAIAVHMLGEAVFVEHFL